MQNKEFHIKLSLQLIILTLLLICVQIETSAQQKELIGEVTADQIFEADPLFKIHSNRYKPKEEAIQFLTELKDTAEVIVFFGSWCRESRKYLPGLVKSLKLATSDFLRVRYIGVNKEKNFPESFLKLYNIKYIPTVVVHQGNEERGRIEEAPQHLIELELVEILKKEKKF